MSLLSYRLLSIDSKGEQKYENRTHCQVLSEGMCLCMVASKHAPFQLGSHAAGHPQQTHSALTDDIQPCSVSSPSLELNGFSQPVQKVLKFRRA